jgi:hypothetical protein
VTQHSGRNLTRLRDAKLLIDALRHVEHGSTRHEFLLRLRRSFRAWGSLTPAMREALEFRGMSADVRMD